MSYIKLKERLVNVKLKLEKTSDLKLTLRQLDKEQITKDLIQYFIFFEELETKVKNDKNTNIEDYKKQIYLVNKYVNILEKHLS